MTNTNAFNTGEGESSDRMSRPHIGEIIQSTETHEKCKDRDDTEEVDWDDTGEEEEDARVELGLIGKIWTNRHINSNAFITTMKNVWQPKHGVEIRNIDKNMFVFQFFHWRDKQKIIQDQPWHFDNHALLLGHIDSNLKPSDVPLFDLPMWVRVYNLPFKGRLNILNIEKVGNKIGFFVKMDNTNLMGIDKSIRMRVLIDVRKPLVKSVKLKMRGGMEDEFEVKYEKPPIFCFVCGMIGHGVKDCDDNKDVDPPVLKYDMGLKASPWKSVKIMDFNNGHATSQSTCAKSLFVTKPKAARPTVDTAQVLDMVNHMIKWF